MIKAVVFDLDGTLVDSVGDLQLAANQLLAEHALAPLPRPVIQSFIGNGIAVLVERCFAHYRHADTDLPAATARFRALYAAGGFKETALFDGVAAALAGLREDGYRLGLCTNKDLDAARAILGQLGIAALFNSLIGGDSLGVHKPDPRPLLAAAAGCGALLTDILYVGDSETDSELSQRSGVPLLLYTGGYRKQPAEALHHALLFDDFSRLPALVAGWAA
jgi:phosphoglycolate phosphatase